MADIFVSVREMLADADMPDPTIPIPFERFASLKNGDMLNRAAFWSFYAAWAIEQQQTGETSATLATEARHDGQCFSVLSQQLWIRDALLVRREHLARLEASHQAVGGYPGWLTLTLLLGIALGMLAHALLVWIGTTL